MDFPYKLVRGSGWEPGDIVVVDVENCSEWMVNLYVLFRGNGKEVNVRVGTFPGWPVRRALPLEVISGRRLFLERTPGCFKAMVCGANLLFEEISDLTVSVSGGEVKLNDVRVDKKMPAEYTMPSEPLVDSLHQWRGRDWPGKTSGIAELKDGLEKELAAQVPGYPGQWSSYGGWKGKMFAPGGFFRVERDGSRWWLVDPDGNVFWSIGCDCIRPASDVNITGIEGVFEESLPDDPQLRLRRKDSSCFNALGHNLKRVFGGDWQNRWKELTRRRLIDMRFNTVGNWSDGDFIASCGMPYVFTMAGFPGTSEYIFRDFPDVYSEEYEKNSAEFARQLSSIRGDRNVIGYFMTNEPNWAFVNGFDLGKQLMLSGGPRKSLDALIRSLAAKYCRVENLNKAWGAEFASFDDLLSSQNPEMFAGCSADTLEFTAAAVERYVRLPAQACRREDPDHLNLGLRWAWIHSEYQLAGAEVLDAFSINCYKSIPDSAAIAELSRKTGKPMMIGEFHIGSLDRGLPSGGILNTMTTLASAGAYSYYIENAAAIPELLGAHYFQWNDQHVMGRFDGENMRIGLCDICNRVYPELRDACRTSHPRVYLVASGQANPFNTPPELVREGTLCW